MSKMLNSGDKMVGIVAISAAFFVKNRRNEINTSRSLTNLLLKIVNFLFH